MPAVSRRSFFNGVVTGSALAAGSLTEVKTAFAQSVQKLGEPHKAHGWETDDGYWAEVRNQFMLDEGFAYLNTGTLGPTPRPVVTAMNEYWRLMAVNPNENSQIFQDRQERIRVKAASFIGATPDEVAITRNTTEGTTILVHGLDMKAGDEVLITQYEHNSLRAPRMRILHFANPLGGFGCFTPVKQLAALAHSKNILCFIDGAHCPGMVQMNIADWGVDGFACNSHKWLCGAAGAGLLYVKKDLQERIWPNISIAHGDPKGARKYDELSRL